MPSGSRFNLTSLPSPLRGSDATRSLKIRVNLARGVAGVAHGVQDRTGAVHDIAAGKNSSKAGHVAAIYYDSTPIVQCHGSQVARARAGECLKAKRRNY